MPIPLGVLAVAGAGAAPVPAGNAYELLQTITVGSGGQASITFSNINTYTDYRHLQIRGVARGARVDNDDAIYMRVNGSNTNNYRWHVLRGTGSTPTSETGTDNAGRTSLIIPAANATANTFGAFIIDILDHQSTNKYKVFRSLSGSTSTTNRIELVSTVWFNATDALTSILLGGNSANLAQYSRFSLYGLRSS